MSNYCNTYEVNSNSEASCECDFISGNSLDIEINKDDCEIRADVVVERKRTIRLWGQVKDCDGNPVPNVLVKLLKITYYHGKEDYIGIAHTIADCSGLYQFDLDPSMCKNKFKIIISKSAIGKERVLDSSNECIKEC